MNGLDLELADALRPWDGRWYYPLPDPGMRFVSLEQHSAIQILGAPKGLKVADAKLLQAIITTEGPLSPGQGYWLNRLCREHDEKIAA